MLPLTPSTVAVHEATFCHGCYFFLVPIGFDKVHPLYMAVGLFNEWMKHPIYLGKSLFSKEISPLRSVTLVDSVRSYKRHCIFSRSWRSSSSGE